MALALGLAVLGIAAAAGSSQSAAPGPKRKDEAIADKSEVLQSAWTNEPFREWNYGREPFKRRRPVAELSTQSRVLEDVSLRMTPEYKEFMRQKIDDALFDDVPFRGERASRWAARDRRRLPVIRHPNSEQAWMYLPKQSEAVRNEPQHHGGTPSLARPPLAMK